jgi:hypothetical protein
MAHLSRLSLRSPRPVWAVPTEIVIPRSACLMDNRKSITNGALAGGNANQHDRCDGEWTAAR